MKVLQKVTQWIKVLQSNQKDLIMKVLQKVTQWIKVLQSNQKDPGGNPTWRSAGCRERISL